MSPIATAAASVSLLPACRCRAATAASSQFLLALAVGFERDLRLDQRDLASSKRRESRGSKRDGELDALGLQEVAGRGARARCSSTTSLSTTRGCRDSAMRAPPPHGEVASGRGLDLRLDRRDERIRIDGQRDDRHARDQDDDNDRDADQDFRHDPHAADSTPRAAAVRFAPAADGWSSVGRVRRRLAHAGRIRTTIAAVTPYLTAAGYHLAAVRQQLRQKRSALNDGKRPSVPPHLSSRPSLRDEPHRRSVARTLRGFTWKRFALLLRRRRLATARPRDMATYLRAWSRQGASGRSASSTSTSSCSSGPSGSP